MRSKNLILDLTELLAVGSVTTAGYLIGGTVGASVMAGLGINLASTIIGNGSSKLKARWLESKDGILNHDIQKALLRAYLKSLSHIEDCYFIENEELPKHEKKQINQLIESLTKTASTTFIPDIEKSIQQTEITKYLYGNQNEGEELLHNRIKSVNYLDEYGEPFKNYFLTKILSEIKFWFGEELKTDSTECNKAWRAFQRLLLEGIKVELTDVKASQEEIKADLTKLIKIEDDINKLADKINSRTENEPFQANLNEIQSSIKNIAETTTRTEQKIDALRSDIKKLVEPDTINVAEIPIEIKSILDEASNLWATGDYNKSKELFEKALFASSNIKHNLAIAKSKRGIAGIILEFERKTNEAIELYKESLKLFRKEKSDKDIINVLGSLGEIYTNIGDFAKANSYLSEAQELVLRTKNKLETAHIFHSLGWLEDHKGNSDNSIEFYTKSQGLFFSVYENDPNIKAKKEAVWGIAGCYHLKGLVYRHKGDVTNAKSCFISAIDWYNKENLKPEIAKISYLLAELHFREAEYEKGFEFLNDAKELYSELELSDWSSRCLELSAKVHNTLGKRDEAENDIKQAFLIASTCGNTEQQVNYLIDLGLISKDKNEIEESIKYFTLAKQISFKYEYYEDFATCVKVLAEIATIEKKIDERNSLLLEGIKALEKYLLTIQSKPRQGFITGRIGMFYELLLENEQALTYYQKAKKIFEEINDIAGIANALGSIASIKRKLIQTNEEFEIYRELRKILEGTPYYDLIAGTAINLGEIYLELGNLNEAKILFDEALYLCKKYNLHTKQYLEKSIKRLNEEEELRKFPEFDFHQLIDELFELINWFPEAKDSIFRLWMWARQNELLSNYKNTANVKYMVCLDDVSTFNSISKILSPYGDLFLQVVSLDYPETGLDIVPYPKDKPFFFELDCPTVKIFT